jgi:structure-specific recognition protein 1
MNIARVKKTSGAVIAEFDENKGTFLTPRGRYSIELYDSFLRMRGAKYDYKIRYDDISRLFLLPKQDDMHMAFVIALDKPIRQGQQVSFIVIDDEGTYCCKLSPHRSASNIRISTFEH